MKKLLWALLIIAIVTLFVWWAWFFLSNKSDSGEIKTPDTLTQQTGNIDESGEEVTQEDIKMIEDFLNEVVEWVEWQESLQASGNTTIE